MNWAELMDESKFNDELSNFLQVMMKIAQFCPPDKGHEFYESQYASSWEAVIDSREPKNY